MTSLILICIMLLNFAIKQVFLTVRIIEFYTFYFFIIKYYTVLKNVKLKKCIHFFKYSLIKKIYVNFL